MKFFCSIANCLITVVAFLGPDALAAPAAKTEPLQGVVTQVIDGDTLRFNVAGQPAIEVRLAQIDAPEICQAWGAEAKRALSELALNKPATLRASGLDHHGRSIGVLVVDGASVGQRLVQEGHAWSLGPGSGPRSARRPWCREAGGFSAQQRPLQVSGRGRTRGCKRRPGIPP